MKLRMHVSAAIVLLAPGGVFAGWSCGIDNSLLPNVYALEVIGDKLYAYVGPGSREDDGSFAAAKIERGNTGDWRTISRTALPVTSGATESCMNPPPDEEWLAANRERVERYPGFEQEISTCTTGAGKRWGGISFYGGEGLWGVGGIVEEDLKTGAIRYYRSRILYDYSTSHLEYFGGHLWIATASYGECGTGLGVGLLSGYFANDQLYADWSLGAGTCGFLVSDMAVHSGALWIATELGLSKVTLSGSKYRNQRFEWTNYVPTGNLENPMREVTCDELYAELFRSEELATAPSNDSGHPYEVLWSRVNKLRPQFAWRFVRRLNGLESPLENEESK